MPFLKKMLFPVALCFCSPLMADTNDSSEQEKKSSIDRDLHLSLSGYYVSPKDSRLASGQALAIQLASAVGPFKVGFEYFTLINLPHSYKYDVPYGKLEEKREYDTHSGRIFLRVSPWHLGYFTPYFGGYLGASVVYDTSSNSEAFNNKVANDKFIVGGPAIGIEILPNSAISIFAEVRRSFQLKGNVQRETIRSVDQFGQQNLTTDNVKFNASYIGAGLRFNFY